MKLSSRLNTILRRRDFIQVLFTEVYKLEDKVEYMEQECTRLNLLLEELKAKLVGTDDIKVI